MSALAAPVIAGGLVVAGVVAAAPASVALARARWPERSPTVSLVLWQALCLCAGLSLTGAALVLAIEPLGGHLPGALITLLRNTFHGRPLLGLSPWRVALLAVAVIFAAALLAILIRCFVLALLRRRAHRDLLDLLTGSARTSADEAAPGETKPVPAGVRVVDHRAPVAYSVPGWHTRLVLTAGLVDLLSPAQLGAVVAHERAHLQSHHDLLLLPFQAWSVALGALPGVDGARRAVATLAEMQADDVAAKQVGASTVAAALATVALADRTEPGIQPPPEVAEVGGTAVVRRVRRLQRPQAMPVLAVIGVWVWAVALLAVPTAALFLGWS